MKNKRNCFYLILCFVFISSCASVKPYDMMYLNDSDMQIGTSSAKSFENYVQSIREGAASPGSAKASGGCGCN